MLVFKGVTLPWFKQFKKQPATIQGVWGHFRRIPICFFAELFLLVKLDFADSGFFCLPKTFQHCTRFCETCSGCCSKKWIINPWIRIYSFINHPKNPSPPPMETPDPPSDTPGPSKQMFLTPHDIPRILRAIVMLRLFWESNVPKPKRKRENDGRRHVMELGGTVCQLVLFARRLDN